jgi:hypothetical protein
MKIKIAAFIVGISLGLGLTYFYAHKPPRQAERRISPREAPIPLRATKENKGQRCAARYYFGVHDGKSMEAGEGYTPYCYELQLRLTQAVRGGNLAEVKEALRLGANPESPVNDEHPPLLQAARTGRTDIVSLLLDNGADVNGGTFIIGTPLIIAAGEGHTEVVSILLERGADVCTKSDGAWRAVTAEDVARERGFEQIVELIKTAGSQKCE